VLELVQYSVCSCTLLRHSALVSHIDARWQKRSLSYANYYTEAGAVGRALSFFLSVQVNTLLTGTLILHPPENGEERRFCAEAENEERPC
jgi:hypothetical protein